MKLDLKQMSREEKLKAMQEIWEDLGNKQTKESFAHAYVQRVSSLVEGKRKWRYWGER